MTVTYVTMPYVAYHLKCFLARNYYSSHKINTRRNENAIIFI